MWHDLTRIQKIVFTLLMAALVPFMPELILMAEIGGMEFIFAFLVLYYKPTLTWLASKWFIIKAKYRLAIYSFSASAFTQPKVYFTQVIFYSFAILVTGSMVYSSIFFLPAFFMNVYPV